MELSIGTEIHDNATDSEWDCESQDGDDTVVEIPLSQPDLMQFSQEQQATTQQQQVATPLPSIFPGFLMLTVTTIVAASKVTVQGPFAHWFEKFELPHIQNTEPNAASTPVKRSPVKRTSPRSRLKKVAFTPSTPSTNSAAVDSKNHQLQSVTTAAGNF